VGSAWRDEGADGAPAAASRGVLRPSILRTAAYADWDAIYADNVARVYRLMFAKVGNRPDAEDLTSQVFLAAYSSLRTSRSAFDCANEMMPTSRIRCSP